MSNLVHVFDIDHTLIKNSTALCFLKEGLKRRAFNIWHLAEFPLQHLRYRFGTLENALKKRDLGLLTKMPRETFNEIALGAFESYGRKLIFQEGLELIEKLKGQGSRVIFATTSFDFLVQPLADYMGVKEVLASRLEVEDGCFTGRLDGPVMLGENKRREVLRFFTENEIPFDKFVFYSDSHNDLPLLRECPHPVAVNPDRRLRREAAAKGWKILKFRRTLPQSSSNVY